MQAAELPQSVHDTIQLITLTIQEIRKVALPTYNVYTSGEPVTYYLGHAGLPFHLRKCLIIFGKEDGEFTCDLTDTTAFSSTQPDLSVSINDPEYFTTIKNFILNYMTKHP